MERWPTRTVGLVSPFPRGDWLAPFFREPAGASVSPSWLTPPHSFLRCPFAANCREKCRGGCNLLGYEAYARLACGRASPLLPKREAPATHNPVAGALLPPFPIDVFLALEDTIDVKDAAVVVRAEFHQLNYCL